MADDKKISQKLRLLYLDKILYEETDDMHSLIRSQINGRFADFGLEIPDRDTFADDIKQCLSCDIDDWDVYAFCYVTETGVIMDKCKLPQRSNISYG